MPLCAKLIYQSSSSQTNREGYRLKRTSFIWTYVWWIFLSTFPLLNNSEYCALCKSCTCMQKSLRDLEKSPRAWLQHSNLNEVLEDHLKLWCWCIVIFWAVINVALVLFLVRTFIMLTQFFSFFFSLFSCINKQKFCISHLISVAMIIIFIIVIIPPRDW